MANGINLPTGAALGDSSTNDRRSTVEKATTILAELAIAAMPLTLSQLSRRTGIAKTTTHRLLGELLADGLIRRHEMAYLLNNRVSWLAPPIDEGICRLQRLRPGFLPHLIDLYEKTRGTVNFAVLRCEEVIYVERIYGHNRVRSRSDRSDRAPARLTAAGKLLLAHLAKPAPRGDSAESAGAEPDFEDELERIRSEGIALSFGDLTSGVCCIAAPVRDRTGHPVAAVALAGLAPEFDPMQFAPAVRRTAHALSLVARGPAWPKSTRRHWRSAR
jgi:DNA-binding IclR family transcriptional regulator